MHLVPGHDVLRRNTIGSTRERRPGELVAPESLEVAIGRNVRELRQRAGLSVADMAVRITISKAMLSKIENAQTSCSLATLDALARGLDVPVTSLFRGAEGDRQATFTAADRRPAIVRNGSREGHVYEGLGALRGPHTRLEPLLVTLTAESETLPLFQHPGTEVIHVLSGRMGYSHSNAVYDLGPGDSLMFDGEGQHGPVSLDELPVRFLSIIAFPDNLRA